MASETTSAPDGRETNSGDERLAPDEIKREQMHALEHGDSLASAEEIDEAPLMNGAAQQSAHQDAAAAQQELSPRALDQTTDEQEQQATRVVVKSEPEEASSRPAKKSAAAEETDEQEKRPLDDAATQMDGHDESAPSMSPAEEPLSRLRLRTRRGMGAAGLEAEQRHADFEGVSCEFSDDGARFERKREMFVSARCARIRGLVSLSIPKSALIQRRANEHIAHAARTAFEAN